MTFEVKMNIEFTDDDIENCWKWRLAAEATTGAIS